MVNILVTSSRAPVALELIRAFGRAGHQVYATDTQRWTVGSHSRWLREHTITPAPRYDSLGFANALGEIIERAAIDWLIPTSEEVFFVARHYEQLVATTKVFTEPLDRLHRLHHKYLFQRQCATLGIATPRTVLLRSSAELQAWMPEFPTYLLKPAYSRFATKIITNCGPRAGKTPLSVCQPSAEQPWLLQEYLVGPTFCSYSMLHNGHVTLHGTYRTPYQVNHGSGVQFVSVASDATLPIVQRLGAALNYTGQLSLDFICDHEGRWFVLECNPRATSGLHLCDPSALIGGLLNPQQPTIVTESGRCRQLSLALIASAATTPQRWPELLRDLTRHNDIIFQSDDPQPAAMQILATLGFAALGWRKRLDLVRAMTDEIEWNGEEAAR